MRLSYSALGTYKQCPLRYKFKEIDRLKEPKSKEQVFGTVLHATMKFIHTPAILSPPMEQAMDYFAKNWNSEVFENEAEERAAFSQGIAIVQKYYEQNSIAQANIVDLESMFTITIGAKDDPHTVSGIINRIDKPRGGYEIIDYKTEKKMPSQESIDNDLQLSIYLLAFLRRYPKERDNLQNITVSLYFLKHGVKLSSTRTEEQLKTIEQTFLDVIHNITAEKFEPIVSPLCSWCGFQKICPMWRHKFKEERKIDTEEITTAIKKFVALKSDVTANKQKLAKLQEIITHYMDQEKVERVFSDDGIIVRTDRKTYIYDTKGLREILEPLGKWNSVLKIDGVALGKLILALPNDTQAKIQNARKIKSETKTLTVKKTTPETL